MKGKGDRPIADSYWVKEGLFLAGEYPGAPVESEGRLKAASLLDAGIRLLVDLTEEGEKGLRPYVPDIMKEAERRGLEVDHRRMAIIDVQTPSVGEMIEILDEIDSAISAAKPVYVHCFGGIGRTGTVVGCHLVRHGNTGEDALDLIARWREGTPDGYRESPETLGQRRMVLEWREEQ